jgi:DNA-binding response OmpR family regulator
MARILVVATSGKGPALRALLEDAGHEARLATSFQDALAALAHDSPDLLATEVQLGAFNGFHVVIRHRDSHPSMRVIVIGPYYDSVLAHEATNSGATYVAASTDDPELIGLVAGLLVDNSPARRWPRKRPIDPLVVRITDRSARVLDLSYGGLRFETNEATDMPASLKIEFPDSGVAIEAQRIWCQPTPVGSWFCGVAISSLGQSAQQAWRQLVDAVPAAT